MKTSKDSINLTVTSTQTKLLIVEDNRDHWILIQGILSRCLPTATLVHTAGFQETINLLVEKQTQEWELPKLMIIDLYLPTYQEGLQLVRHIKAMDSPVSHIPILMLSASANSTDITSAYQAGVAAYMLKPVIEQDWLTNFQSICEYWYNTITLPPTYYHL
ncbi:response regulator [Spirosoma sp.]|uniref:response regulator n=1 Tax=Spirosoma sp. TaxID=1899569 RepID=UPI002630EFC7|nr:response regulator [Spirosoma sp.]MCX6212780.1 response regulator [Spirosoma sp.]